LDIPVFFAVNKPSEALYLDPSFFAKVPENRQKPILVGVVFDGIVVM
jgi:hypothetical protein